MFSVVIPVFNHERFLIECVLSAVRSRLVSEVLLLDDGSTDGSYEIVRSLSGGSLPKVRDITPTVRVNRGAHVCLNELVRAAKCEWVAVLNSDDTFTGDRFELMERILRTQDAGCIFGDLLVMNAAGKQLGVKNGPFHPQFPFPASFSVPDLVAGGKWVELLSNQNFIATTSNLVFQKTLFERIGGFAPFRYIHDWDFALRAALHGKVMYLPHPLASYRLHASNTIKESSDKVDAEARAMFAGIKRDFPALAENGVFQAGLASNEYLHERKASPFSLNMASPELYRQALAGRVVESANGEFIYAPQNYAQDHALHTLHPGHLQNALLALAFQDLDFVLVSHTLAEPPMAGIGEPRNHLVFRQRISGVILRGEKPARPLKGRVARLLPGAMTPVDLHLRFPVEWGSEPLPVPEADGIVHQSSGKPVVFVLPALFAVGGVERLMVEMMRQLGDRYEFVVITVERLSEGHGSLHGQADGLVLGCYDLAELAPNTLFLPMMRRLKEIYRPALLWMPNGSPWQCDQAQGIREVFRDIPIVDQQVYDTVAGWVARYHEPGIQSYDRFVAINTKIRDVFTAKYGIALERIDLIYHSINVEALGPLARTEDERKVYRERYGLPQDKRLFGWVGRLTVQKRPLEFLTFVQRFPDEHFVMIGNGELADECDEFIADRNMTNVTPVRFSNTMGELFAVMSGLLSTSAYEGLPISMLEAIAMGVPVFSTDVGDVGLILDEYNCGAITAADWNLARYARDFEAWREGLPFQAQDAASKIRERFAGKNVAALYDESFRRALDSFPR